MALCCTLLLRRLRRRGRIGGGTSAVPALWAMLFIAEQRAGHQEGPDLLSPRDFVEMLKETLSRKPENIGGPDHPDQSAPCPLTRRY